MQNKKAEKKLIIVVGHAQTGKSSLTKDLTGDDSIICGKSGNGGSTTKAIQIHQSTTPKLKDECMIMDTMAPNNQNSKVTPQKFREEIERNILALSSTNKCDSIQGILITESLKDSSHQLRNNLQFITQIFGYLPNKSLVILGTKGHKQDQDELNQRENALMQIMKQYNIPQNQYFRFDTSYQRLPQQSINNQQYKMLETALKNCSIINVKEYNYINDDNVNNSTKEKKNINDEFAQKMHDDKIQLIDQIAKRIQKEKTQLKKQPYTCTWTEQVWKGNFGKILGIKEDKVFSKTRYLTSTYVPSYDQCHGQALNQIEQGARQKLLMMK